MKVSSSQTTRTGNRFARRKARTREDLLSAAVRVLAHKGFHDTKITDLAAEADVGVGTFYLHFETKDALFDALVEETVRRLKAAVDAARLAVDDPVERMRRSNAAFCRFADQNREVFRIVFGHAAAYHDVIQRAQDLFAADIEANVREGIAAGVFAPVPTDIAAQAVVGMATRILSWWTMHESIPITTLEETMSTIVLHGMLPSEPKDQPKHEGVE
jgi:AcrR family transcriptional regulator